MSSGNYNVFFVEDYALRDSVNAFGLVISSYL